MDERRTLIEMLRQLPKEMELVTSQGAGYYTCVPFAHRYNKLLGCAKKLLGDDSIVATFDPIEEIDPMDPADKSKMLLGVRIEVSQLITLLDSVGEDKQQ